MRSIPKLWLAGRALLAVAACSGGVAAGAGGSGVGTALGAPLPDGRPRVLHADDDGTAINVGVGETLAVALVGMPTAGYIWQADGVPDFLAAGDTLSGPTISAQLEPGYAGGDHWEVLVFRVAAPGSGKLTLAQRRPWESDEPPTDTFEVDVRAQ